MDYSDDDDRPRRQPSTRERNRDHDRDRDRRPRDAYDDDAYAPSRNSRSDRREKDLSITRRRDDSVSSVEGEITRDFPPGDRGGYYREKETTIRRSGHRPVKSRSFEEDRYDDRSSYDNSRRSDGYSVAKSRNSRYYDDRRDDRRDYDRRDDRRSDDYRRRDDRDYDRRNDRGDYRSRRYDYSDDTDDSPPPRRKKEERRKSLGEEALAALGLGGVAGALLGKKDDDRERSRSRGGGQARYRGYSDDRDDRRSRSRGGRDRRDNKSVGREQVAQALKAAVLAGASEAFRVKDLPGGWGGEKGKRILTAAISAGGVDSLISNRRDPKEHGTMDVIGSAIAGLATNRLVNGSTRSASRGRNGSPDARGRSESKGGALGDLVSGGVLAAAGKKAYDSWRSRSRGRQERSESESSYDSRDGPQNRKRSKSVSGMAAKAAAAVGLHDVADKIDPPRRSNRRADEYDDYRQGQNGGGGYDYQDNRDVGSQPRSDPNGDEEDTAVSRNTQNGFGPRGYTLDYGPHHTGDPETDSDSSLGSSSAEEKDHKKSRRKQWISAGLATVATIHAAHNVYESMEQRRERQKELKKGEITKEQAKKMKQKARLQDAASIGIAALGIKGAYSEWKEMRETRQEYKEEEERIQRHAEKREARRRKMEEMKRMGLTHSASTPNLRTSGGFESQNGYVTGQNVQHNGYPQGPSYYDDNPYGSGYPPYSTMSATDRYNPHTNSFPPPPAGQQPPPTYPSNYPAQYAPQ